MDRHCSLFALALVPVLVKSQYWTPKAPFPSTAEVGYSFAVEDRLFAGGGLSAVGPAVEYTAFNEYLPASNTWVARSPLPNARYGVGGFSLLGKGYVACGWHLGSPQLTDLWEYDPIGDSWTQKTSFPGAGRYSTVAVATIDKAYFGLGYSPYANDWWEYDPIADSWTQKASFPMVGRQAANAFVIDGLVYVGLGARDVTALSATLYTDWYRYDPAADTWTSIATFPAPGRVGAYAFSFDGIGYVFCGAGLDGTTKVIYNDGWAYDALNDQWLMLGLFPGIPMDAGFSMVNTISAYIGTGCVDLSGPDWVPLALTDAFWEYNPGGLAGIGEGPATNAFTAFQQDDHLVIIAGSSNAIGAIDLFDATGRQVMALGPMGGAAQARVNIAAISNGLYIVRCSSGGTASSRLVVIE